LIRDQYNFFDLAAIGKELDPLPKFEGKRQWVDAAKFCFAITSVDVEACEYNLIGRGFKLNDGNILFDVGGHIKRGVTGVGHCAGGHGAGEGKQS